MQGRYLIFAATILFGGALTIFQLDLSGWWMMLVLWIACVPILLEVVNSEASD
jgi:hypothetical protein